MASAEALFAMKGGPKTPPFSERERQPHEPVVRTSGQRVSNGGDGGESIPSSNPSAKEDKRVHVAFTGEDVESIPSSLWEKYGQTAKRLDLSYNTLKSLSGLEHFSLLEELVLDNNELPDSALTLPRLPHLHTLTLNKNQIEDTDALLSKLEKSCPNLRYLSLLGNRACPHELLQSGHDDEDYQKYRYYVLHRLPSLTFLDSRPVTQQERKEAKRVGSFMRVVRPSSQTLQDSGEGSSTIAAGLHPLPASRSIVGQHKGVYGQCKYVYYGKHSEGNRFIRNHHL